MHVDYLPKSRIEAAAMRLLGRYGQKFGEITAPPVPIDEIIECHLDLTFDFDDLVTQFGSSDVTAVGSDLGKLRYCKGIAI